MMGWFSRKTVVVPVDFSDESFQAVADALEMVEDASHLHVVNVLPVLMVAEPGIIWDAIDNEGRCQHAQEALADKLSEPQYAGIHIEVFVGDPGHEIADFAQQSHADLIVMPSHGRTGLKRLLIGSVAERVVRLAHCPVLVLRR